MTTECQCDMPMFAYRDWLAERGWDVEGLDEELDFTSFDAFFLSASTWKTNGCPMVEDEGRDRYLTYEYYGVLVERPAFVAPENYDDYGLMNRFCYNYDWN